MKLLLLTLCVIAVTHADVRWDPSGQYRILVTEPVEDAPPQELKIDTKPSKEFKLESTPIIKKYDVVDLDSNKLSFPYRAIQTGYYVTHADVRWDPSGQYRILVTEPVEDDPPQELKIDTKPSKEFKLESTPIIKKYNVVDLDSNKFSFPCSAIQTGYSISSPYVLRGYLPFHYDYKVTN